MLNRSYIFPFFISLSGYVFMVSMDTVIKVLGSNYPMEISVQVQCQHKVLWLDLCHLQGLEL